MNPVTRPKFQYEKTYHKGYDANIFIISTSHGFILKKVFNDKKPIKDKYQSPKILFQKEVEGIRLLDSLSVTQVMTPKILQLDYENLWYTQKYFKLVPFLKYLVTNSNPLYTNPEIYQYFYQLGVFLAKFHNKYKRLHGDLNRKNILFGDRYIFICDPSSYKHRLEEKYSFDLFRTINNLYSYNIFARLFISNKDRIVSYFLKGYTSVSHTKINSQHFKKDILRYLKFDLNPVKSKNLNSLLKHMVIEALNRHLSKQIELNQLKWIDEI